MHSRLLTFLYQVRSPSTIDTVWRQAVELSVGGFGDGALPSMVHLGPDSAELAAACCVQQREGHVQVMLTATCVVNASQVAQTLSPA